MAENVSTTSAVEEDRNLKLSKLQIRLRTLLSGGLAGCIAKTAVAPFDSQDIVSGRITGVFEALYALFKRDGLFGIYRGHSAMLVRIFPYAGINFFAYEYFKEKIKTEQFSPALHKLLCGSLAGATSVSLTYPLDIIRAQLAYQTGTDFLPHHQEISTSRRSPISKFVFGTSPLPPIGSIWRSTLFSISHSNDKNTFHLKQLYRGYTASLCGIIPYAGVSFCTFETLKHLLISSDRESVLIKFLCGLLAGICGQTAAYPFDVVRRRMQLDSIAIHIPHYRSPFEALVSILRQSGLRGLYVGISINYLKVSPATAISFVTYEYLKKHLTISK